MALLELDELTRRFGGLVAVDHISMRVEEGEVRAVIGPNGAGKSTYLTSSPEYSSRARAA